MYVSQWELNRRNPSNDLCRRGDEHKRFRLAAEEAEAGEVMALTTYDRPLTAVLSFKYMGRVLSSSDDNWPEAIRTLRRAQK